MSAISQDKEERKNAPMARGLLDYFPAALAAVAECSRKANEQHNPGEEMHWARDKSSDHADCIIRHLIQRDEVDDDGIPHIVKVAWRALAAAQEYFEAQGATPGRASKWASQESVQDPYWISINGTPGRYLITPREDGDLCTWDQGALGLGSGEYLYPPGAVAQFLADGTAAKVDG